MARRLTLWFWLAAIVPLFLSVPAALAADKKDAKDTKKDDKKTQKAIVAVFRLHGSLTETPADDTTVALFTAPDGAIVKITVSYGMWRPYCLYFSAAGSDGSFEASRDTPQDEGRVFLKRIAHQTAWMALW